MRSLSAVVSRLGQISCSSSEQKLVVKIQTVAPSYAATQTVCGSPDVNKRVVVGVPPPQGCRATVVPSAPSPVPLPLAVLALSPTGRVERLAPAGKLVVGVGQTVLPPELAVRQRETVTSLRPKRLATFAYRVPLGGLVVLQKEPLRQVGKPASPPITSEPRLSRTLVAQLPPPIDKNERTPRCRRRKPAPKFAR